MILLPVTDGFKQYNNASRCLLASKKMTVKLKSSGRIQTRISEYQRQCSWRTPTPLIFCSCKADPKDRSFRWSENRQNVNMVSVLINSRKIVDHVAMILRSEDDPNEVFLIRIKDEGTINIKKWSRIKSELGSFYEKLVYRKLNWQRP